MLFVDLVLLKSIAFTGVLRGWWTVNRLVLMCYFFIKYGVFGWVRWKSLFSRVWLDFWWNSGDFWWCEKWWNAWFWWVLSKWVSNSKWGSRCGNIRYAVPGFRLPTLKCKPRPHHGIKSYYNSTVLLYVFDCQVKLLYTCNSPDCYSVKVKHLTRFRVRLRW